MRSYLVLMLLMLLYTPLLLCFLQSVGRGAASLLDPQFSRTGSGGSGQGRIGRSPSDWAATFDSCFELYGGAQAAEELEQLSSECAHICNRSDSATHGAVPCSWCVCNEGHFVCKSKGAYDTVVRKGGVCMWGLLTHGAHAVELRTL